jgi:hypothetical protein
MKLAEKISTLTLPAAKDCTRCQRWLPARAFPRNSRLLSGLDSWCRECHVETTKQWRHENRDKLNARRRRGPLPVVCSGCGETFEASHRSQVRCPECQLEHRRARKR